MLSASSLDICCRVLYRNFGDSDFQNYKLSYHDQWSITPELGYAMLERTQPGQRSK